MRLFLLLLGITFSRAATPASPYKNQVEPLPPLHLQGEGCHRTLFASDGRKICTGIVAPLPSGCLVNYEFPGSDGGPERVWTFGSRCHGRTSAALGFGIFFVEEMDGGAFEILCDDMNAEQREIMATPILKCCDQEGAGCPDVKALRNSPFRSFGD